MTVKSWSRSIEKESLPREVKRRGRQVLADGIGPSFIKLDLRTLGKSRMDTDEAADLHKDTV